LRPVAFQTGTTAGTITVAVELGGAVERKSVVIPPAPVQLTEVSASRGDRTIEVVRKLREMSPLYELAKEGVDLKSIQWKAE